MIFTTMVRFLHLHVIRSGYIFIAFSVCVCVCVMVYVYVCVCVTTQFRLNGFADFDAVFAKWLVVYCLFRTLLKLVNGDVGL